MMLGDEASELSGVTAHARGRGELAIANTSSEGLIGTREGGKNR